MSSRPVRTHLPSLRALLAYGAITVALTYPLIARLADGVPNDLGDPLLVDWILWWNAHAVPLTDAFWNAPAFYPAHGVLAFSEHFVGLSPITTPIYWLTGNIQLGYNIVFMLTFMLSAHFAYLLCRAITGREDAAFVGGLIYGFMPYRVDQVSHMQMLLSFWMPFGLWGLHRYLQTKRTRWLVVFGVGWLMQGLSSGYLMLFFAVLIVFWIVWFVRWREWRQWLPIGITWVLASVPVTLLMLGYRRIHGEYGFTRSMAEIQFFSADITGLLQASVKSLAWKWVSLYPHPEGAIFPGITAAVLILVSLVAVRPRSAPLSGAVRRTRAIFGGLVILFAAATASALWLPWQLPALGLSNTHTENPMKFGALFLLAWLSLHPWLVRGFKRRSVFAFYVAGAVLMWLLSLGPEPMFFGEKTPFTGPYWLLLDLPGFTSLRVPGRFAMCTGLCLAAAGAIAFTRLAAVTSRPLRLALAIVASALALVDGWVLLNVQTRPAPLPIEASVSRDPLIELPIGDDMRDIEALYRSTFTGAPTVNGYSGHSPPWYLPLKRGFERSETSLIDELAALGVRQVILDKSVDEMRPWMTYFETRPDIVLAGDDGAHRLYRLPAVDHAAHRDTFGRPLRIAAIEANVNPQLIPAMTDGDLTTRWQPGPQKGTEQVTIDLGAVEPVGGVVLEMGAFITDAPRDLLVEISGDRQHWTTISHAHGDRGVFLGALKDPKRTPFTIDVGGRPARFIRLSQLGTDPVWYWSIAELIVFGPAGS